MNDNNKHNNKNDGPPLWIIIGTTCYYVYCKQNDCYSSSSLCVVVVVVFVIIGTHASLMMDTFADSCAWCKLCKGDINTTWMLEASHGAVLTLTRQV